jgi:DNA polymerase elongation subunit (family B)
MSEISNENIIKLLQEKVLLKQEVFEKTKKTFLEIKSILIQLATELKSSVKKINKEIQIEYKEVGDYEFDFTLADETLVFVMHTNIFSFDNSNEIWKNKYVQQDSTRAYCGKIYIYNFLSESFRFNRSSDVGYLLARIFINRESHYFVEGIKQLSYLYNDFSSSVLDTDSLKKILETTVLYSIDFDPFTLPFENISEISVREVIEANVQSRILTGKRLGFQFDGGADKISG